MGNKQIKPPSYESAVGITPSIVSEAIANKKNKDMEFKQIREKIIQSITTNLYLTSEVDEIIENIPSKIAKSLDRDYKYSYHEDIFIANCMWAIENNMNTHIFTYTTPFPLTNPNMISINDDNSETTKTKIEDFTNMICDFVERRIRSVLISNPQKYRGVKVKFIKMRTHIIIRFHN